MALHVRSGVIITAVIPSMLFKPVLSDNAAVIGDVSSTVCFAIDFIIVSGKSDQSAVGGFWVELYCVLLNAGVHAI